MQIISSLFNNASSTEGADTSNTRFTAITYGTGSKGSWSEITSSCPFDVGIVIPYVMNNVTDWNLQQHDIGIGNSGSEKTLIPDFPSFGGKASASGSGGGINSYCPVPIYIRRGERISARGISSVAGTGYVGVTLISTTFASMAPFNRIVAYGISPSSILGTNITCSSANTKGSYTTLTASTTGRTKALIVAFYHEVTGVAITDSTAFVDIGIGGGFSQQNLIPNIYLHAESDGYGYTSSGFWGPFPCDIPEGSTINARIQADSTNPGGLGNTYLHVLAFE